MGLLDELEDMFRARGYSILRSSDENHFLLLEKDGSRTAVGYTGPGDQVTEGESEMFLSIAMNESADAMIFISATVLPDGVASNLKKEGVQVWKREKLAASLGEHLLSKEEAPSSEEHGGIMDLFSDDEDLDPVKELRSYREKVHAEEIGGFKVHDVELGKIPSAEPKDEERSRTVPAEAPKVKESTGKKVKRQEDPEIEESAIMDMPMFSPPDEKRREEEKVEKVKKPSGKEKVSTVPDEVLMSPWAGFEEWSASEEEKEKKKPPSSGRTKSPKPTKKEKKGSAHPWSGSIKLPMKYPKKKAYTVANVEGEPELDQRYLPFLLIKAGYQLESRDDGEIMEKEGTYLYNVISSRITDVPRSLFDEIISVAEKWNGENAPDPHPDPREGYNAALSNLRGRISSEGAAMDRKIRETLMSTIYREIKYSFRKDSLKVISSKRVAVPFWIKKGKKDRPEWMVDAYLGRFISSGDG
ncbi:MAG: hypothetical protein R6V01_00160 [Thermoplasmatota archaeon]